jgi:hypothetical protein
MGKRFIITESEKNDIRKMHGILNEQSDVISQYVTDSRLQDILREIETILGEKFTKEHFEKEIGISGSIKSEAGGLSNDAILAFEKMKKESGCSDIFIKEKDDKDPNLSVSYRTYEDQKTRFINEGNSAPQGQKIVVAMKRVSIPGYSQHHTGLAIDYGGNTICLRKNAWPKGNFNSPNKWGFTLPYMSGGNIRMLEPWHLQYVGTTKKQDIQNKTDQKQISSNNLINIESSTYDEFAKEIREETSGKTIDIKSIDLDFPKKTLTISNGDEKIDKILLIIGRDADGFTKDENLENRYKSAVEKNPNSIVERHGIPTTCNDCYKVPLKYQLLIIKPKKEDLESDSFIYQ